MLTVQISEKNMVAEKKAELEQDVMAAVMLSDAELEATAEENPTVTGNGKCLTSWSQLSC